MSKTNCPHCGSAIQFKSERAGATVRCPKCSERFSLPDDDDVLPIPDLVVPKVAEESPRSPAPKPFVEPRELMPNFMSAAASMLNEHFGRNLATVVWPTVAVYLIGTMFGIGLSGAIDGLTETIPILNNWFYWALIFIPTCVLYLAPYYVALYRGHRNSIPIGIMTVGFGWTAAAWVCCLAWSFSSNVKEAEIQSKLNPSTASQTA